MTSSHRIHRILWIIPILLLLLVGIGVQATFAAPGDPSADIQAKMGAAVNPEMPHVADHVLARLTPGAAPGADFTPLFGNWYKAPVLAGETPQQALNRLAALPQVEKVELDYIVKLIPDRPQAAPDRISAQAWGYEPNDPYFAEQWNFKDVLAPEAWKRGWTGADVVVAVVDTGVNPGPDLACRTFVDAVTIISDTVTTGTALDGNGHGTHVTGTIAQCTDNAYGVAGLAYNAKIMPVKILNDQGAGSDSDVAQGIIWAADHGAKVINMSLGGDVSSIMDDAITHAADADVLMVAAAGNETNSNISYPASHPDVMGISALDAALNLAPYSNYGPDLSLAAPGGDLNADLNGDGWPDGIEQETRHPGDDDWYIYFYQGTSMAAPHVAGAAAMLRAAYPTATAAQIRTALEASALDRGAPGFDNTYGHGVLQIDDAFCQLSGAACNDIILNGDFETDDAWIMTNAEGAPYPVYTTDEALTGARSMYFGMNPPESSATGIEMPEYRKKSRIYQDVAIPADVDDVFVDYWYMPCTDETPKENPSADNDDWQRFRVYDPTEDPDHRTRDVIYMHTLENDCIWKHVTYKLDDAFKGHTMRFNFAVQNNSSAGKLTWMYLDRVRVMAYTYAPPPSIDLSLEKTVNDATPLVGDNVTFAITLTNAGPDDATGVQVTDQLPSGYTYVSDDSGGSYASNTGLWDIGNVAMGATATLHITATVNLTGDYMNVVEVTASNETDSDPGNNRDSASVTPAVPVDLSVTKEVNNATPDVGSNVTFTITASNAGPNPATGVQVTDKLPTGYAYVGDDGGGNYDHASGVWNIGNLANGGAATLQITATVQAGGEYTNTAKVTAFNEIDSNLTNNEASVATTPTPIVDLSLTKTVDNATPDVGSNVVFSVTVSNAGPSDATGVEVTDQLPNGYTYVGDDASGDYNQTSGVWTVGNLAMGASATLHITATVNVSGDYTNVANVSNVTETDSIPSNDEASVTTTPIPIVDLSLTKTVDNVSPHVGDNVTFAITVTNAGPSDATGVEVTDKLPDGYSYVSDDGGNDYASNTGVWNVGDVAMGASATLHITATVNALGDYTNVAKVTGVNEKDSDSANNEDSASITPAPVIAADDITTAPGVPFTMPITMDYFPAPGIGALTLDVNFDPDVITPTGCDPDPDGLFDSKLCNDSYAPGVVRLTLLSTGGVSGAHSLADIGFIGNGAAGTSTAVTLTIQTLTDPGGVPIVNAGADDGSVALDVNRGDVNCDGQVNAIDAMFILQYDVGLIGASQQCPPPDGYLYETACDVNNDNQCNSIDALFIMQCEVGISNAFCPATAALAITPLKELQTADIMVGQAETTRNGLVTIPITADVVDTAVGAGTIELHFDPAMLEPTACQADPDGKFNGAICNPDFANDAVKFTLASAGGVSGAMTLANVTFRAIGEPGDSSQLTATASTFTNTNGQDIPVTISDGKINIRALRIFLPITK